MNPQNWLASVAITAGLACGAHWDDETFLGRGPIGTAGIAVPLGRHLAAEGELGLATHHRNSGYLEATGTPLTATARLAYLMAGPDARARPFVSVGTTWLRSTGHFTSHSLTMGPDLRPVPGPAERRDWKTSARAWEFGAGAELRATDRLRWRPEARISFTDADRAFTPGSLEPPIFTMRAGVTFLWR